VRIVLIHVTGIHFFIENRVRTTARYGLWLNLALPTDHGFDPHRHIGNNAPF
jgi:hypothetical protein